MTASLTSALDMIPGRLLLTLLGVSILFALASANGATAHFTERLLRLTASRRVIVPPALFLMTALIAALGVGNIAATALVAPAALTSARRLGLSHFLTTLLVIGGANAGALSPLSMTGILAKELLSNLSMSAADLNALGWRMFGTVFVCVTVVHGLGFLMLGGGAWFVSARRQAAETHRDPLFIASEAATRAQKLTGIGLLGYAAVVIVTSIPVIRDSLEKIGLGFLAEPGLVALSFAMTLVSLKLSSPLKALRLVPWWTIGLITGMFVVSALIERFGGLSIVAQLINSLGRGPFLAAWLALLAGLLSTISSSSGVVMPLMLPMVLTLAASDANPAMLAIAIVLGAHLVDCSPVSSLGAICIGAAPDLTAVDRRRLFRSLLLWGLGMAPVGALIAGISG